MKKTYEIIFFILVLQVCPLNAQISNHGNLKIETGTDVIFTDEYINEGNHNSDGNLYLSDNLINNGTTTASTGTTFFKSNSKDIIQISGSTKSINFYNLELDLTALIAKGVSVEDNKVINLENSLYLKNGDLRLTGETQLVQFNTGSDVNTTGSGKLLKDQQGFSSVYKFNYWSSPVQLSDSITIAGCMFDGTDSVLNPFNPQALNYNSGSPYNGIPSVTDGDGNVTVPLTIHKNWLYTYTVAGGSYADWVLINENTFLSPGQGYTMKGTGTLSPQQNYVFYGQPNNGDYSFSINTGESALLGNPYPSALDLDKFLTDNSGIIDALYFWVDGGSTSHYLTQYLGGYAVRNLTGGVPPSIASPLISGTGTSETVMPPTPYASVGQSFFVEASATGDIQFNNSQRAYKTESALETVFYRASDNLDNPNQYLRIGYEGPEGFHRQLLLGFLPNSEASLDYDQGYDAIMNDVRDDDIYFIIEGNYNLKYVIQGVGEFNTQMEFPLGVKITAAGIHKMMIDNLENFQYPVYLRDNYTNTEIDLTESEYEFSLPIGIYEDRFSLAFETADVLQIEENSFESVTVSYNGLGSIIIKNNSNVNIDRIEVYNVLGQLIMKRQKNIGNQNTIKLPLNQNNGVYLVVIKAQNKNKSTKILKY